VTAAPESTILVADDDAGVRMVVTIMLQRAGFTVVQATNGREAVDRIRDHGAQLDAVLLDVMMPEMNGHEALPAMRELRPDLPVVFFSGFDRSEVADHLVAPSAYTAFLPKPFETSELVDALERAVASAR
jgi:CheY-like chemotaxis protein